MFWASVSYKTECFYLDELRHAQDESGWPKDFPKARGLAKSAVWEKIVFLAPAAASLDFDRFSDEKEQCFIGRFKYVAWVHRQFPR